jgi:hypothetical protein
MYVYLANGLLDEETECFTILYIQIVMRQLGIKYSLLDSCLEMAVPTRDFEQLRGKVAVNGSDETKKIWGKEKVSRNKQLREPIFKTVQDRCSTIASSAGKNLKLHDATLDHPSKFDMTATATIHELRHKQYAEKFSVIAQCTKEEVIIPLASQLQRQSGSRPRGRHADLPQ